MRNLQQLFDLQYIAQIIDGDFAKFCGLLRIHELWKLTLKFTLVSIARLYLIEPLQFVSPQTQCTRACLALTLGTHLLYDWEAWKISWPFLSQNQLFSSNLFHHAKILSFFVVKSWKEKKINSHGMEQAKTSCQLCIHECSQKSIIKVDLIHCCVIIWKLVLLLGGYLSISRSNLFTNSWLLLVQFKQFGLVDYIMQY